MVRFFVAERVAAGEQQVERFPVVGRVMARERLAGRLAGRHLAAIFSFTAAVLRLSGLLGALAGH